VVSTENDPVLALITDDYATSGSFINLVCIKTNVRAIYTSAGEVRNLIHMKQKAKRPAAGAKAKGERTRQAILESAVHIASAEGLEGLTIGRLATELDMSKSGLFAHFGSKEELQVATVDAARAVFIREVIRPAFEAQAGILRLWKLCDIWLSYVESGVFRGGCFFAAAASEFDSRPGVVRDSIAEIMKEWLAGLRRAVIEAQEAGQLDKDLDPTQLAFEFNSLELGANWAFKLYADGQAFVRARQAILERLRCHATPAAAALLPVKLRRRRKFAR
jgi:AcrR family transcriptional regulator